MAKSYDLVPLLSKSTDKGLDYAQGVLLTWNTSTAENTVSVNGTVFTNLPVMTASEAAVLQAGDVVTLFRGRNSWLIAGKLIIPGTSEAQARLSSLTTQSATVDDIESISSSSFIEAPVTPGPEVSIYVPNSGKLLILLTADISGQVTKTAGNTMQPLGRMGFKLTGANDQGAFDNIALSNSVNLLVNSSTATLGVGGSKTRAVLANGLETGNTTVTAMYRNVGNGTSVNFSNRNITVMALLA